jgi:exonuclease SbcD
MRLLHTSDWHLGRTLHRTDLHEAQAAFLDHLVGVVRAERVDVVLVAGDVYDRAVPSVSAVQLYDAAVTRLSETAQVVVIPGNHDSAVRLGVGGPVWARGGVHLRTSLADLATPVVLSDDHGDVSVFGLPYLEPEAVRTTLPGSPDADVRGHAGVLGHAMTCVRTATTTPRSVVLAHAWVRGGQESESERDITVGGTSRVPTTLFDGVTYTALGHLHGAQALGDGLRYSGSPLAYSFSEAGHTKGSWLVDLDATGLAAVDFVAAPVPRPLSTLRGPLADLLTSPTAVQEHWLRVVLTDPVRPEDAMVRLQARFPHVLVLEWEPEGVAGDDRSYAARVAHRDDIAIATEFVRHVRAGGDAGSASDEELALLRGALEAGRVSA